MKKPSLPLRCQRCALVESCEYLKPLSCPHFREKVSPTPQSPPSDAEVARTLLHLRSKKFIILSEIGAGLGLGFFVAIAPVFLLALASEILEWGLGNDVFQSMALVTFTIGAIVAGFRSSLYSTALQQWRHVTVLSALSLVFLARGMTPKSLAFLCLTLGGLNMGAYLTKYTHKIPLINKLTLPFSKS